MKIRKLQRQNDSDQWINDTYAYQDKTGQVVFRCNAAWERFGGFYNRVLAKNGTSLEKIETVIYPTRGWRWLPTEVIDDQTADIYLEQLERDCQIPPLALVQKQAQLQ
ncbi:MAG: hypothetical protein AAF629_08750 [Chloroflexota bacterium]